MAIKATAERLLAVAMVEVEYLEKKSNSSLIVRLQMQAETITPNMQEI
jgi:hypothetical protein